MITVVADIGATTSRWAWWEQGGAVRFLPGTAEDPLPGHNPLHGDGASMRTALQKAFAPHADVLSRAGEVHLYGAGCGSAERAEKLRALLAPLFHKATVLVESDLLGAARACHGHGAGMVLILGTGMNAGHYDGRTLHLPMPSLGYLLGDEGSGAHIGRRLLHAALHGRLSQEVVRKLYPEGLDLAEVLERTYTGGSPAPWLAAHAARLAPYRHLPEVGALLERCFTELAEVLTDHFSSAQLAEVKASGSIAWHFRKELEVALGGRGVRLTEVLQEPLPRLVEHHRQER